MPRHGRSHRAFLVLLPLLAVLGGCSDDATTAPGGGNVGTLVFGINGSAYVRVVVLSVSGPGIDSTLVFNIQVTNGTASGSVGIPSGSQRLLSAKAFDSLGVNTHRADTTITIQPGTNPPLSLVLAALNGDVPVTMTFGTVSFTLTPGDTTIGIGDTVRFGATIRDAENHTLTGVSPGWASTNPAIATVDAVTGLVTARQAGTTAIVAVYAGASATRTVHVVAGPVVAVASGSNHTCALNAAGKVYCWGTNWYGQLGTGTTLGSDMPLLVSGGLTFRAVAVGTAHTCALTTAGAMYCWGGNWDGQLGNGTTTASNTPVAVTGGLTFRSLAAGYYHTCGLAQTGVVYCFGWGGDGELGNGSLTLSSVPVAVAGGYAFQSLTAAGWHSCGIAPGGAAYCWGLGTNGRLGNGATANQPTPVAVSGGVTFTAVFAGTYHTCGLTATGAAYCWGSNGGKLGDGTTTQRLIPTPVSGGQTFQTLALGGTQSCGIKADGTIACWGSNYYGQIGGSSASSLVPIDLGDGRGYQTLAAGFTHTCGVSAAGYLYCLGGNSYGQLGNGAKSAELQPGPVLGGIAFGSLSGNGSEVCGVTTGGTGYCWGTNYSGQLGDGTTTGQPVPTAVGGGITWQSIKVSANSACGLAAGGTVYCWGLGNQGQLGDGTSSSHGLPAPVAGGLTFVSLPSGRLGGSHACARSSTGDVYCWGDNAAGKLGDGTTTLRNVPTLVTGGLSFSSVATGDYFTCGIAAAGAAYCWGDNARGQLGDGTITAQTSPVAVLGGLAPLTSITAGSYFACALNAAGVAYCWGDNSWGQLGDGTYTAQSSPVVVSGGLVFSAISAGDEHACGITTSGQSYCWGKNDYGQLGIGTWPQFVATPTAVAGSPVFVTLATGSVFACGATAAGAASCWGYNMYGELGRGTYSLARSPVAVTILPTAAPPFAAALFNPGPMPTEMQERERSALECGRPPKTRRAPLLQDRVPASVCGAGQ